MATKISRDVLDWFRTYAQAKFTAIGLDVIASNMNLPLNNNQRVEAAVNYLLGIEQQFIATFNTNPDFYEPFWGPASNILDTEVKPVADGGTMPANVAADYDALWADPDPNVKALLKVIHRVLGRAIQTDLAGQ
jgi:hypothetical protein